MRRLWLSVLWVVAYTGCAPTNFAQQADQNSFRHEDYVSSAERLHAGQSALLGTGRLELAADFFKRVLDDPAARRQEHLSAALGFAYVAAVNGQPESVRRALEAGLPVAEPQDAELLLGIMSSFWGSFEQGGPVPEQLKAKIQAIAEKTDDAWTCVRSLAHEQLHAAGKLVQSTESRKKAGNDGGLVTQWRVSAPWSSQPFVDLNNALGPESRPLAKTDSASVGFETLPRSSWLLTADDGEVYFTDMPETGGIGFAQTYLQHGSPVEDHRVFFTVESNRPTKVFLNGTVIASLHDSPKVEGWTKRAMVRLPKGGGLLTVKMATSDGIGFVRVRALPQARSSLVMGDPATSAATSRGPQAPAKILQSPRCIESRRDPLPIFPSASRIINQLIRLELVHARPHRDLREGHRILDHMRKTLPNHPAVLASKIRLQTNDSSLGRTLSRSQRQTGVKALLELWPEHVPSLNLQAKLQWTDGLVAEAVSSWKRALKIRPSDRPTLVALLNAYTQKGWRHEALGIVDRLEALPISGPRALQEAFDTARHFGHTKVADRLSAKLMALFPQSALTRRARHIGGLDEAGPVERAKVLLTLWSAQPNRLDGARRAFDLFLGAGEFEHASQVLRRLGRYRPDDVWTKKAWLALALRGRGKDDVPNALKSLGSHVDADASLGRLRDWIEGRMGPQARLRSGEDIVRSFRNRSRESGEDPYSVYPVVNLLDATESIVRSDGRTLTLTHVVRLVQTKAGVDQLGELRPPRGSSILQLRTLKANGDVLWPERVPGKHDVSFSGLVPGDAVEWAWIVPDRVRPEEGGYLTGLAFAQWGIPTWKKSAKLTLASNLNPVLRVRNGAPTPTLTALEDGRTQLLWSENDLLPITREPQAAGARVFFPYVDIAVSRRQSTDAAEPDSPWQSIRRTYYAHLENRLRRGWRTARRAGHYASLAGPMKRLKAAASWVQREIRGTERFNRFVLSLEQALARGQGNRSLVFAGLARELGSEANVLLCLPQPHGEPHDVRDPTPNANRYWYPVVEVRIGEKSWFFDVNESTSSALDIPVSLYGARCLTVGNGDTLFRALPKNEGLKRGWSMKVAVRVDKDGNAELDFTGRGQGPVTRALRQVYQRADAGRQRLIWQQWLSWVVPGSKLIDFRVRGANDPGSDFQFRVRAQVIRLFVRENDRMVTRNLMPGLWARHFSTFPQLTRLVALPVRTTPLQFETHREDLELTIHAPSNYTVETALTTSQCRTNEDRIRAEQTIHTAPGKTVISRSFDATGSIVDGVPYADFRQQILEFEAATRGSVTLVPTVP